MTHSIIRVPPALCQFFLVRGIIKQGKHRIDEVSLMLAIHLHENHQ